MDPVWPCFFRTKVYLWTMTQSQATIKCFGEQVSSSPWPVACLQLVGSSASTASVWSVVKTSWSKPEVWHVLAIFADMNKGDWFFGGDRKYFRGFSDWNLRRDELLDWFRVELLDMDAIDILAWPGEYCHKSSCYTIGWIEVQKELTFLEFLFGRGTLSRVILTCLLWPKAAVDGRGQMSNYNSKKGN